MTLFQAQLTLIHPITLSRNVSFLFTNLTFCFIWCILVFIFKTMFQRMSVHFTKLTPKFPFVTYCFVIVFVTNLPYKGTFLFKIKVFKFRDNFFSLVLLAKTISLSLSFRNLLPNFPSSCKIDFPGENSKVHL